MNIAQLAESPIPFLRSEHFEFLNASKYCGSVLKNDFVVVVLVVADEILSNFQRI